MKLAHGAVVDVVPTKDLPAQYGRLSEATGFRLTGADVWRALASVAIATAIGLAIYSLGLAGSVVLMLYLIVALLIATRADGFFYALFVSMGSVFAYNFFFTIPRFTLHAVGLNYPIIFAFLLVGTFAASSLAIRMKRQAESTARRAYRMEVLLESSRKLQGARNADECFRLAAEQVIKLLNRPVVMYRLGIDGRLAKPVVHDVPGTLGGDAGACALASPEESAVAAWSAANNERAGATTDTLADSQCLYLPIHSKDAVFGVAGIAMDDIDGEEDFGAFEKNLLLAILDECGQTTEQIVFAEDRRRMEMRMEKETLRANLLRTISHDLRTPLTSISGDADMLLHDRGALSAQQKEHLYRDIHDDACWLVTLVENLLSITRIDNGTLQLAEQPELVADVVREALQHVDRRAGRRRVDVELEDELLMADMDARLIVQVIINLVNNAVSYTPADGRIVVSARRVVEHDRPRVRIAVADEGPGISEEDRKHIFDMFYNGSTGRRGGKSGDFKRGMGLGLSLCRSIVEVHGGTLDVRNVNPHGSEFSFTLAAVEAGDVVARSTEEARG